MKLGMDNIIHQAQKMQEKMKEMQNKREKIEIEGSAGGDLVKIIMAGNHDVKSVKISPELMNEDKEILEDLISAAVNDAVRRVEEKSSKDLSSITQGFNLPNGFKFPS